MKAGQKIGLSGISGVNGGTYDPHVHFNIFSTSYFIGKKDGKNYLEDPAYYVYWKTERELTDSDKKVQNDRKDLGKNSSISNFKSKLSDLK